MEKFYHTVAFDLDGTLSDPVRGLTAGFKYAFRKMGIDYGDEEILKTFIGPPIRETWQELYGITEEEAEEAVFYFREYYSVYGWWDNDLYPKVRELLADLKAAGRRIILATSKPEVHSSKILDRFALREFFDFSEGASFDSSREKKCDVLNYAMEKVGITESERPGVVLVGDTGFDIEGAKLCGVDSIAVSWGYGGGKEALLSFKPDYIVDTVDELRRLLL